MEPPTAVAHVTGDNAEVWAPVQSPRGTREDLAKLLASPRECHRERDAARRRLRPQIEMRLCARSGAAVARLGAPVKVPWTREDDFRTAFSTPSPRSASRPGSTRRQGDAWRHRSVSPTIVSTFEPGANYQAPFELGMGLVDMPFAIPNVAVKSEAAAHTRIGWFRSVSNIPHAFAVQSFVAELAARRKGPQGFLLELIGPPRIVDPGRVKDLGTTASPSTTIRSTPAGCAVVELAAEKAGWGRLLPPGQAWASLCIVVS